MLPSSVLLGILAAAMLPLSSTADMAEDLGEYAQYLTMPKENLRYAMSALGVKMKVLKVLEGLTEEQRLQLNPVAQLRNRRQTMPSSNLIITDPERNVTISPYCGYNSNDSIQGTPDEVVQQLALDLAASSSTGNQLQTLCLVTAMQAVDAAIQAGQLVLGATVIILEPGTEGNNNGYTPLPELYAPLLEDDKRKPGGVIVEVEQIINKGCGEC